MSALHFSSRLLPAVLCLVLASSATAQELSGSEKAEGFASLFDGKSLQGWEIMNGGKFRAENGVIKLQGGRGWLRSEKEFGDFVLRLEVRWLKPRQDSGIFLRASKEGKNWPDRRYEVQCENSERVAKIFGAAHKIDPQKAFKALKPGQEWNMFEIHCAGSRCDVKLNGEPVCTGEGLKNPLGHIGLQGEGGQLEFRNLRIKALTKIEKKEP